MESSISYQSPQFAYIQRRQQKQVPNRKGKTQHNNKFNLKLQSLQKSSHLSQLTSQSTKKLWKPLDFQELNTKNVYTVQILRQRNLNKSIITSPLQSIYQRSNRYNKHQNHQKSRFNDRKTDNENLSHKKNMSQHKETRLNFEVPAFRDTLTYFQKYHFQNERHTHNPYKQLKKRVEQIELPPYCQKKYQIDKEQQLFLQMYPELKLKENSRQMFNQLDRKRNFKKLEQQSIKKQDKITKSVYIRQQQYF